MAPKPFPGITQQEGRRWEKMRRPPDRREAAHMDVRADWSPVPGKRTLPTPTRMASRLPGPPAVTLDGECVRLPLATPAACGFAEYLRTITVSGALPKPRWNGDEHDDYPG